ncbi:MAG: hypothetical protein MHM6MM_006472 [Cercozoa sp. M6MM]
MIRLIPRAAAAQSPEQVTGDHTPATGSRPFASTRDKRTIALPVLLAGGGDWMKLLLAALVASTALQGQEIRHTPLDEFVDERHSDPTFHYEETGQVITGMCNGNTGRWQATVLMVHSLNWLDLETVDRTLWRHQVAHVEPVGDLLDDRFDDSLTLWITGGRDSNVDREWKETDDELLATAAMVCKFGVRAAVLKQIPSQALCWKDEAHLDPPKCRSEDDLIARTWREYVEEPEKAHATRTAHMAMTRATTTVMDVLQQWSRETYRTVPAEFVVAGGSKRGWTAWLTAAVEYDKRVVAVMPIVLDILDFFPQVDRIWRSFGGWPWALYSYFNQDLIVHFDNPRMKELMSFTDPIEYVQQGRFDKLPTLIVSGVADEFFMPDNIAEWWPMRSTGLDQRREDAAFFNVRHGPNCNHPFIFPGCPVEAVLLSGAAWIKTVLAQRRGLLQPSDMPKYEWRVNSETGAIEVEFPEHSPVPVAARVFSARTSPFSGKRDFRWISGWPPRPKSPVVWTSEPLEPLDDDSRHWRAVKTVSKTVEAQKQYWRGFFIEFDFEVGQDDLKFEWSSSTGVSVVPRTYPYKSCAGGEACRGKLL